MRVAPRAVLPLILLASCGSAEDIRVRDRGALLVSGRARVTRPVGKVRLGGELGGYGAHGHYGSAASRREYDATVGYLAFVAELRGGAFTVIPKVGVGLGDVRVEGQTRTLREDGLGGVLGVEGRYAFAPQFDGFARGTWFARSSLDATIAEVGLAWRPNEHVALEVGYAVASHIIDEVELIAVSDSADVETQGLLLGATLTF